MTRRFAHLIAPAVLAAGVAAAPLAAQTRDEVHAIDRATELSGGIGAAASSTETAAILNGSVDWRLTRWVAVEARGSWLARGRGVTGLGADVGGRVNLVRRRAVTPYVGAAFGLYRARMNMGRATVSDFYRGRADTAAMLPTAGRTFTDPAWRLSAGLDVVRHRNLSIRPEATMLIIHRAGATETIASIAIRLGYIFEDHPVTPSTR
jgi:hypothetical protein